ncbi:MAG: hypothetical protein ACOY3Y_10145 [Acidobacteriota bacterium]
MNAKRTGSKPRHRKKGDLDTRTLSNSEGKVLLISDLGWTRDETAEVKTSLSSFERLWDVLGMEAYDEL